MADLTLYRHDVDWRQQYQRVQAATHAECDAWHRYMVESAVYTDPFVASNHLNRRLDDWIGAKHRLWDALGKEPPFRGKKRPVLYLDEE